MVQFADVPMSLDDDELTQSKHSVSLDDGIYAAMFQTMLDKQSYEEGFRKDLRKNFAERLKSVGGWKINLAQSTVAEETPSQDGGPALSAQYEISGGAAPVSVIDSAVPAEWCKHFVTQHTAAGFIPQHTIDATVGSPQAMIIRKLINETKHATVTNPNSRNFRDTQNIDDTELYGQGKNTSEVFEVVSADLGVALWNRLKHLIPAQLPPISHFMVQDTARWRAVGIVPTFRFMRYNPGQQFKPHHDPSRLADTHPITGKAGHFKSLVTIALYLNDAEEFEGGGLHFVELVRNPKPTGKALISSPIKTITPKQGRCVIFEHRRLHEAEVVSGGTKHMVQCDVLYEPFFN